MDRRRVAVVFDDRARPETTGTYCLRALKEICDPEHIRTSELTDTQSSDFDLFIKIDDGFDFDWPRELHPAAFWAIDTHIDFDLRLKQARNFDYVFAAQRDGTAFLSANGIESAQWLPLACDDKLHLGKSVEKRYDACFIGNLVSEIRIELVRLLQRSIPRTLVDQRFFMEMTDAFAATKVVFNRSVKNDINMRVFEALGSGSFLLTNDLTDNGLTQLFQDGVHLATYRCAEELVDKARYYLANEEVRERIAQQGQAEVLEKHTYRYRMQSILEAVEQRPRQQVAKSSQGLSSKPTFATSASYFDFARPELLALVDLKAQSILEVGCGSGRLGASIKARQLARVVGIEMASDAASKAKENLDEVLHCDIEKMELPFEQESFDCVICGDVLEHLMQPDAVLRKLHSCLRPGGQLIVSIPNARNHSVIGGLLEGNWTYESAGLLDHTHLRFFARRDVEQLLYRTGFEIDQFQYTPGPGSAEWIANGRPTRVCLGHLDLVGIPPDETEEFFAYQFLVSATRAELATYPLTSVVVVANDHFGDVRQCIESVQDCTDEPFELILVHGGARDGALDYLGSISGARIVEYHENRGFASAARQGIAATTGNQIALLQSHVVVTTGWLRRMLDALYGDERVTAVGPVTNDANGAQRVDVSYDHLDDLESFAWKHFKERRGQRSEVDTLEDFCCVMRREAADAILTLEKDSEMPANGTTRSRLLQAHGRTLCVHDAFVHQAGHSSGTQRAASEDSPQLSLVGGHLTAHTPSHPQESAPVVVQRAQPGKLIRLI